MLQYDFTYLFSAMGLLPYDTKIGGLVRFVGGVGMLGAMAWLWMRYRNNPEPTSLDPI